MNSSLMDHRDIFLLTGLCKTIDLALSQHEPKDDVSHGGDQSHDSNNVADMTLLAAGLVLAFEPSTLFNLGSGHGLFVVVH